MQPFTVQHTQNGPWDLYSGPFRARAWAVCSAYLGDFVVFEEVEKSMGLHFCFVSLSRSFRCVCYGCVVVLRNVCCLRIDIEEYAVDLVKVVPKYLVYAVVVFPSESWSRNLNRVNGVVLRELPTLACWCKRGADLLGVSE
jgi:hypothetical protein